MGAILAFCYYATDAASTESKKIVSNLSVIFFDWKRGWLENIIRHPNIIFKNALRKGKFFLAEI